MFSKGFRRRHFSYLFKRLDYFTISSVDCQQLIWIFWKRISFSVFQKQFLAIACLLYHCRKESSSTFFKFFRSFFDVCASLSGDLFTLSHVRFFVNNYFCFFKTFQIVYSEETILRDSSVRITLSNRAVNTFFQKS